MKPFQLCLICGLLIVAGCSGSDSTVVKREETTSSVKRNLSTTDSDVDSFDYQSLFTNQQLVSQKSTSTEPLPDTLTDGLYWLNLDVLELKPTQTIQVADFDPAHDYFIAVDVEPRLVNLDSIVESIRIDPEIRQQLGPSRVWIKLLINRDGKPKDYFVVKSPDNRVSREVLDKLRFLRAKPAYLNNKAVKCWINVQYNLI
jgi:hypothetical protein